MYVKQDLVPMITIKNILRLEIIVTILENIEVLLMISAKETPVIFHNVSIYDYHFINKELAKEFEGKFECLGENKRNT